MKFKFATSLISGLTMFASIAVSGTQIDLNVFFEFKQLMMYFNEPLLQGAKVKGFLFDDKSRVQSFEGAESLKMAKKVSETIKIKWNMGSDIQSYAVYLNNGIKIIEKMVPFDENTDNNWDIFTAKAKTFQDDLKSAVNANKKLVLPFGWVGKSPHAINLIIEMEEKADSDGAPKKIYNLIIVNTGDGLNHHYSAPDPNNVYPWLNRLWIEFKGIEEEKIFEENAWFAQMMIKLQNKSSVEAIEKVTSAPNYFYASILSNFKNYLHDSGSNDKKLSPAQRSGSCTLSSLMASYLYYAENEEIYNYNRVMLGHKLLEAFFLKNGSDQGFQTLITDGFDLVPRKLFYATASALAQQLFAYLEVKYVKEFKNSAFIGKGRSDWIRNRKDEAIEILKNDKTTFKIVQDTAKLCRDIIKKIESAPINSDSNNIIIEDNFINSLEPNNYEEKRPHSNIYHTVDDGNFHKFLEADIQRRESTYSDLDSLKKRLEYCRNLKNDEEHFCALDAFRMAKTYWWNLLDDVSAHDKALELLELFGALTRLYLNSKTFSSFDDIVYLAHLQIGSWKCALIYDEKTAKLKLGLKNFSPPFIIHRVLSTKLNENRMPTISGAYENWTIKTTYTAKSLSELSFLLEEYLKIRPNGETVERFMGPGDFLLNPRSISWEAAASLKKIQQTVENKKMYDLMMDNSDVKAIIDGIKNKKAISKSSKWISAKHANYQIFMTSIQENAKINEKFPHFFKLWSQMIWAFNSFGLKPLAGDKTFAFKTSNDQDDVEVLKLSNIGDEKPIFLPGQERFKMEAMTECHKLKFSDNNDPNLFFKLRHSQALSLPANIINFESWLNYVKGASDPSIFDHPYFLYLSEYILNVPRIDMVPPYKIDLNKEVTYPVGFTKRHIGDIFDAFMRLINQDLNYIVSKQGRLELAEKTKLIRRSVNIAIPLVKFIGRVDYDKIISGHTVGVLLSKIYMIFYRFSPVLSDLGLEDTDISLINLVLAQITDLPIRNPKTFIDMINKPLGFPDGISIFRKSLSRVHWFITKMSYSLNSSELSHANDLYRFGFIYHLIKKDEIPIMTFLLKNLFLIKHAPDMNNQSEIKYFENGDIVHLITKGVKMAVQLSSGKVVKNGNLIVSKDKVFNNPSFQKFFAKEDMNEAVKGEICKISLTVLYILSDFKYKDNTIVFLCPSHYDAKCEVYRKYNKTANWYVWKEETTDFTTNISYQSIHGHKLFLFYDNSNYRLDAIIIADDRDKPLFSLNRDYKLNNIISIDNFSQSEPWYLLKRHNISSNDINELDKHLKTFTETGLILALQIKNVLNYPNLPLVVIYPGLRLKEDPDRPLSLVQNKKVLGSTVVSEFEIKNSSGFVVESAQSIKSSGIEGTLIARDKNNQRFILAPIHDPSEVKFDKLYDVEMIPLNGTSPAPQTRFQKLLLAFYAIRAREYGIGRGLLQPFVSINQNEVFSPPELEVLTWIIKINGGGPEAEALKLVAYTHLDINKMKFPLEYVAEKDDVSEEGLLKKLRLELEVKGGKTINATIRNYLLSIRDLPEKFYIYRIFPEFLNSKKIKKLISTLKVGADSITEKLDVSPKITCECDQKDRISQMDDGMISGKTIFHFLDTLHNNPNDSNLKRYLEVKPKLMHKINGEKSTVNENEMIIYCASKNLDKWKSVAKEYITYCKANDKPEENTTKIIKTVKVAIDDCIRDHRIDFRHFVLPTNGQSRKTEMEKMFESFNSDSKDYSTESPIDIKSIDIVDASDLETVKKFINEFSELVKTDKTAKSITFEFVNSSKVLQKLSNSIAQFINNKGKVENSDITLTKGNENLLEEFLKFLNVKIADIESKITSSTMNLAIKTPHILKQSQSEDIFVWEELNRHFHQRKKKTFENLYSCYQKLSVNCVQAKFPQLDLDACRKLLNETLHFYSRKIFLDFLKALKEKIEKIRAEGNKVSVNDISLFLDEAKKIEGFNKRLMKPVILNFEYRSKKYRLRDEQVEDIKMLTTVDKATNSFKSAVIQRMMAAGKTLVIGTISVVQKALEDQKLSILVPPSSLYQSNLSSMQERTYSFFKTKGQNFVFPRLQFSTISELDNIIIPFLNYIYESMKSSMKAKEYYVLSPDSLQAFLNAYIEMLNYATFNCEKQVKAALKLYSDIYDLFNSKGSIIMDEIDMTMDPKKELNFPTMENEPFNLLAATLMTDLIEFSVFDPKVKKIGLDIYGNNQSSLTSEGYNLYKDRLIEYIESQLNDSKSLWSGRLLDKDVKDILTTTNIISFLKESDIAFMRDWIEKLYKKEKNNIADTLIIIKVQLYQNLKASLNASANLNYGASGSNRAHILYAIPFLAANTPSPSSEFADRWETLNKTLLMLASVSCSKIIAKNMIGYLRKSAIRETSVSVAIEDTQTYKTAQTLIENVKIMSLNDHNDSDVDMIYKALKIRSPTAIRLLFSYAIDEIFSEMKFPVEQITSNALNMASMFNSVQGYSGTIDNVNILPREVVLGAYENHMENEKNNGGISYKLVNDSGNETVHQLTDENLKLDHIGDIIAEMIDKSAKTFEDELSAIIDAGAFFKNFKNSQVAEAILIRFKSRIEVVLYYDEESNQVQYIKENNSKFIVGYLSSTEPDSIKTATQVALDNRFTFYDQRHITGSDILQPPNARALMTIGTRVLLRDILQGTLRMRQFMTSQKVHLITSTAAANFYFSKCNSEEKSIGEIRVADLLTLGAFNEDEKQQVENDKLAYIKINTEVRRFALEEITRVIKIIDEPKDLISAWFSKSSSTKLVVRDLFIRYIKEKPIEWMETPRKNKSETVLKNYTKYWLKVLSDIALQIRRIDKYKPFDFEDSNTESGKSFIKLKQIFESLTAPFDKEAKNMDSLLAFLGSEIVEKGVLSDGGCEVQMQVFTQNLVEFDLEKLSQKYDTKPKAFDRKSFDFNALIKNDEEAKKVPRTSRTKNSGVINLNEVLFDPGFVDFYQSISRAAILSKGTRVFVSTDLIELINYPPLLPYKIYSKYTWEGSHILVQILPNLIGIRVTILSTESANEVRSKMIDNFDSVKSVFWLCDLYGTISLSSDSDIEPGESIFNVVPLSKYLFFDALVFNGSFDHIISNPVMKTIYTEKWLKSEDFQLRAKFILLRMHNLAQKAKHTFGAGNADMEILNRAAQGDKDALNSIKSSSSAYKKSQISEKAEQDFFNEKVLTRSIAADSISNCNASIDASEIFKNITNNCIVNSSIVGNDAWINALNFTPADNQPMPAESNTEHSTVNDFEKDLSMKTCKKYLNVVDDPNDWNIGNRDHVPQNAKPRDFSVIIVIVFGLAAFSSAAYYYYRRSQKSEVQISPEPVLTEKNMSKEYDEPTSTKALFEDEKSETSTISSDL